MEEEPVESASRPKAIDGALFASSAGCAVLGAILSLSLVPLGFAWGVRGILGDRLFPALWYASNVGVWVAVAVSAVGLLLSLAFFASWWAQMDSVGSAAKGLTPA